MPAWQLQVRRGGWQPPTCMFSGIGAFNSHKWDSMVASLSSTSLSFGFGSFSSSWSLLITPSRCLSALSFCVFFCAILVRMSRTIFNSSMWPGYAFFGSWSSSRPSGAVATLVDPFDTALGAVLVAWEGGLGGAGMYPRTCRYLLTTSGSSLNFGVLGSE